MKGDKLNREGGTGKTERETGPFDRPAGGMQGASPRNERSRSLRVLTALLVVQVVVFGTSLYGYAAGTDAGDAGLTEEDVQEQTGDGWNAYSERETGTATDFGKTGSLLSGASPRSAGAGLLYDVGLPRTLVGTDGEMYYEVTWDNGETERETGTAEETKRETGTSADTVAAGENEEGACLRTVVAHGNAKEDYQAVVRIVKPGVIGEAQAAISVDGGQSWLATFTVDDTVRISGLGLKLEFSTEEDTDEFAEGDTFRFITAESFAMISDHPEAAVVAVTGHPLEKSRPTVTILSSGPRGTSKFSLRMQDGTDPVAVETVPAEGVYTYGPLRFYFSDSTYIKGYTFSGTIIPNEEKVGMGPVIVLAAGVVILVGTGVAVLSAKKEKPGEYELRPWVQRQGEEAYK